MNAALINYLETLPETHLQTHVAAYPWFTAARVVLAKKQPGVDLLRSTAVYVQDREWFRNYYQVKATQETEVIVPQKVVEAVIETTDTAIEAYTEPELTIEHTPQLNIETETISNIEPAVTETHTYVAETENEVLTEFKDDTVVELPPVTTQSEILEVVQETSIEEVDEEPIFIEEPVSEEPELNLQPKTFNDWLQAFNITKEGKVTTTKLIKEQPDELETLIQSNIPYQMVETKLEAETHYAKGLDSFIAQQKQLKKTANANPVFDENTKLPVTETFAKLLAGQNKYKQAISIYKRLSLKFPSKSAYFAAHIKELESKI